MIFDRREYFDSTKGNAQQPSRWSFRSFFIIFVFIAITGSLYPLSKSKSFRRIIMAQHPELGSTSSSSDVWEHCGNSSIEAKRLGCEFDVMVFCWVPASCYIPTKQTSENFLQISNFKFYEDDHDLGSTVSLDDVRTGKYEHLYTSYDFHIKHCEYMWLKQAQAVRDGDMIDSDMEDIPHTQHCMHEVASKRKFEDHNAIGTELKTSYISCRKLAPRG
jgi:hypothetical protein